MQVSCRTDSKSTSLAASLARCKSLLSGGGVVTASERLSRLIGDAALGVLDRVMFLAAGVLTGVEVAISAKPVDLVEGASVAGGLGIPGGTQVAANGFKVGISRALQRRRRHEEKQQIRELLAGRGWSWQNVGGQVGGKQRGHEGARATE